MNPKQAGALPEKTGYTKYFEHDGALRAYANRMMWFGISAVLISFVLALLLFYVRVQPPTPRAARLSVVTDHAGEVVEGAVGQRAGGAAGSAAAERSPMCSWAFHVGCVGDQGWRRSQPSLACRHLQRIAG